MTNQRVEKTLDEIKQRMINLKDKKFFGTMYVELNYKDGGLSSVYIGDRELIKYE